MPPKRVRPAPVAPAPAPVPVPSYTLAYTPETPEPAHVRAIDRLEVHGEAMSAARIELLCAVAFAKNTMRDMANTIAERDEQIAYLTSQENKEARFAELQTKVENLEVEVANRDTRIAELEKEVSEQKETIESRDDRVSELENELEEQRCEETDLVERIAKLTEKLLGHEDAVAEPLEKYELRRAVEDLRALH